MGPARHLSPARGRTLAVAFCLAATSAAQVRAEGPGVIRIAAGDSRCPTGEAVARLLTQLTNRKVQVDDTDAAEVYLVDEGDRFSVIAASTNRHFGDPARNCQERARAASVFAAMVLSDQTSASASPGSASPPEAVPPPTPAPTAVVQSSPSRRRTRVFVWADLNATADLGGAVGERGTIGGGMVDLAAGAEIGRLHVGLAVDAGATSPLLMQVDGAGASVQRTCVSAALRATGLRGPFEVGGDAGLAMTILHVVGVNLPTAEARTRLEAGVRLAAFARWWVRGRFAPQLGFAAVVVPSPLPVSISPDGVVGRLPRAWLTGSVGVAVRIH